MTDNNSRDRRLEYELTYEELGLVWNLLNSDSLDLLQNVSIDGYSSLANRGSCSGWRSASESRS